MSNLKNKGRKVGVAVLQLIGKTQTINSQTITVKEVDGTGLIKRAEGTAAASTQDAQAVYAKGAQYTKTDATDGTKAIYENVGTAAISSFNLMGDVSSADISAATVTSKALTGFVSGAGVVAATDTILQAFNKIDGNVATLSAAGVGGALADGNIIVGNAGGVATSVNPSGDVDVSNAGVFSIGTGKVLNSMVADSTGVGALGIRKSATVLYDFSVVGGAQGAIALTGSPTIPDNAVVWVESYDVLTTCTSGGGDAATIKLELPTDGDLSTAIAISDGSNPWDAGAYSRIAGGLATPLTKKTTGARVPNLFVGGGQDLTAGKIVFQLAYWVSQ